MLQRQLLQVEDQATSDISSALTGRRAVRGLKSGKRGLLAQTQREATQKVEEPRVAESGT